MPHGSSIDLGGKFRMFPLLYVEKAVRGALMYGVHLILVGVV